MERILIVLSGLIILFVALVNYLISSFDSDRNGLIENLNVYGREFVTPYEYQYNDFFVINHIPEKEDFYNNILEPKKKTFFVLKQGKSILDLQNLPSDINGFFDKKLLFKQDNNKHLIAFRTLYTNTSDVCTLNRANDIICRSIDINKK